MPDTMMFDIETIISIIIAVQVGALIFYAYNKYSSEKVDKVYQLIASLYEQYGDLIKKDNPQLATECEQALETMKKAMEDGSISALEALEIAEVFVPLASRLVKFVKDKYAS